MVCGYWYRETVVLLFWYMVKRIVVRRTAVFALGIVTLGDMAGV